MLGEIGPWQRNTTDCVHSHTQTERHVRYQRKCKVRVLTKRERNRILYRPLMCGRLCESFLF